MNGSTTAYCCSLHYAGLDTLCSIYLNQLESAWTMTSDDRGSHRGQRGSAEPYDDGWTPDRDWTQPLRGTEVSLKTGDRVWRWFTAALIWTMTWGMGRHGRQVHDKHEAAEESDKVDQHRAGIFLISWRLILSIEFFSMQNSVDISATQQIYISTVVSSHSDDYVS